jgi:uncharacterized protein YndB with AHSA1/START domain
VRSHDLTLELERIVPAPAREVFAAFTEPGRLAAWWGPAGFSVPALDFAPQVGEAYRIEMQPPEGEAFRLVGEFREVDPPARLAFTFRWEPPAPDDVETLVDLTLTDLGESTKVVLMQGEFTTRERRELHRDGWTQSFERLERLL